MKDSPKELVRVQEVRPSARVFPDAVANGRKGGIARAKSQLDHLTTTREYLNAQSQNAARYVVGTIADPEASHDRGLRAAQDVLNRTIGNAPTELRVGPADQTLELLRELELEAAGYEGSTVAVRVSEDPSEDRSTPA